MNERAELEKEKRRKKFKNDAKRKKSAADTAAVTPFMSPREAVLALLEAMRAPAHVAVLSLAYKKKTGRAIKDDHRHGGMLNFLRTELKEEVLLVGSGNDSFAQLATPSSRATHWLRECVRENGPLLVSMLGRLYHEVGCSLPLTQPSPSPAPNPRPRPPPRRTACTSAMLSPRRASPPSCRAG